MIKIGYHSCASDLESTVVQNDTSILKEFKSYKTVWQRSLRKIKFLKLIQRFNNLQDCSCQSTNNLIFDFCENVQISPQTSNYLISQDDKIYYFWILIILICLLHTSTYAIYVAAFEGDSLDNFFFEIFVEIIFFLDMFFMMNLVTYNNNGLILDNRNEIILYYLQTYFLLDLASAFPSTSITIYFEKSIFSDIYLFRHSFKMIKLIKIAGCIKRFTHIKSLDFLFIKFKHFIEIIVLLASVFLMIHIFACLLFLSSRHYLFNSNTWVVKKGLIDSTNYEQYIGALYWATTTLTTVGYGDIHPYLELEKFITILWICLGILVLSISVGRISMIFKSMLSQEISLDKQMHFIDEFSKNVGINKTIKNKLKRSIREKNVSKYSLKIEKIISTLDSDLRYEIANSIYNQGISKIPFFRSKSSEFLSNFIFLLDYMKYDKDVYIWHKNAPSDGIYFIVSGKVKYIYKDLVFFFYSEGGFFGDTELFIKSQRKFNVLVCELCKCFKISISNLRFMQKNYPVYFKELTKMRKVRTRNLLHSLAQMKAVMKMNSKRIKEITIDYMKNYEEKLQNKIFQDDSTQIQKELIRTSMRNIKEARNKLTFIKKKCARALKFK